MNSVSFTIQGIPVGKGRARHRHVVTKSGKEFTQSYTPAKTRNYETTVRLEYERQVGRMFDRESALEMRLTIYKPIPKSATKRKREQMINGYLRPAKKPDTTNITKSVEDGLNGVAYHDDSQIVDSHAQAFYSDTPCVQVTISRCGTAG